MEFQPEPQPPLPWLLVIETLIPGVALGAPTPLLPEPADHVLGWTTTDPGEHWE